MPRNGPNVGFIRPEVEAMLPKYSLIRDSVVGEDAIKAKKDVYLPIPETNSDPIKNRTAYAKYLQRAVWFPVTGRTLDGMVGQVFSKDIAIDVPSSLEYLVDDIDGAGTTIDQHAKDTLNTNLSLGRGGLLADFTKLEVGQRLSREDVNNGIRPRIIRYGPDQMINHKLGVDNGRVFISLLVLKEFKEVPLNIFESSESPRWRVYEVTEQGVMLTIYRLEDDKKPEGEFEIDEEPRLIIDSNERPFTRIPFSPFGACNNDMTVDEPPLYPIAILNIHHYCNSADYEQSCFLVGQATPVFTGLDESWMEKHIKGQVTLGSSNGIGLPKNASAMLLQAAPNSMPKEAMQHKEDQMKAVGAKLIEPRQVATTATEAAIEESSEASVLSSNTKNVSAAYELAFHYCSMFMGDVVPVDQITVQLNSEFQVAGLSAQERQEVVSAWQNEVLSWTEVRDVYRRKGIAFQSNEEALNEIQAGQLALGGPPES